MSRADIYLALCLLDAIEDSNIDALKLLLAKHNANPNTIVLEKGIAPMHLVIGADDVTFAERATALMLQHGGDANLPATDERLTPLHVAANLGRVGIVRMLLAARGNLELLDDEGRTPIQHAIKEEHFEVVQVIQNHVFEAKIERKRKQLLFEHHQQQQQQKQIQQDQIILSPRMRHIKSYCGFLPSGHSTRLQGDTLSSLQMLEERKLTPNKIHYNFDATSPYYVNITHRRKDRFKACSESDKQARFANKHSNNQENISPLESSKDSEQSDEELNETQEETVAPYRTNLFELTERNLKNFTQDRESTGGRTSFIECWREKIADLRRRSQISRRLDDIDKILNSFSENLAVHSFMDEVEATFVTAVDSDRRDQLDEESIDSCEEDVEAITVALPQRTEQEVKLDDTELQHQSSAHESVELQSVGQDTIIQISEEYIHTDDEAGVVFREKKMTSAPKNIPKIQIISDIESEISAPANTRKTLPQAGSVSASERGQSFTSLSTCVLPLDYDTDALRTELTMFGEPPGPIVKTSKKLYLRKLVKFRRHAGRQVVACSTTDSKEIAQTNYSVELMATVRKEDAFQAIVKHQSLEHEMAFEFQSNTTKVVRNFREGHLKKSFIYLLLDSRISDNLPAQQNLMEPHELWQRFLSSVFYVGKGKSSRPYCHLYDAMKLYQQRGELPQGYTGVEGGGSLTVEAEEIIYQCTEESLATVAGNNIRRYCQTTTKSLNRKQMSTDSEKLNRIIDIWSSGKGVVCLHVFHNIMPVEAYTREAAIIDAFGVQNLTNLKRGDYYGKCQSWPMKKRKQLGILLLHKAMLIFLAEGETHLMPNDLI
ncbi:uncharacterized protein LOC128732196 [Anopheles nili]|uniref:uncharacterized protein LOC128732196 n=1 Tax=Anopheles nili TaxID=185578 RepID=UPI00237B4DFF|nr:uncharacterized protein LOC128732196 [Anopheles nili]